MKNLLRKLFAKRPAPTPGPMIEGWKGEDGLTRIVINGTLIVPEGYEFVGSCLVLNLEDRTIQARTDLDPIRPLFGLRKAAVSADLN